MNTERLYDLIWRDRIVSSQLMAVVPCNALKYIGDQQGSYIVNVNVNSYLRGDVGHWVFLRIHDSIGLQAGDKISTSGGCTGRTVDSGVDSSVDSPVDKCAQQTIELFDSLGSCIYNEDMEEFIKRFSNCNSNKQAICNTKCGFYVLVYAYYSCRNFKAECILNILNVITDIEGHCCLLYGLDKNNEKKKKKGKKRLKKY